MSGNNLCSVPLDVTTRGTTRDSKVGSDQHSCITLSDRNVIDSSNYDPNSVTAPIRESPKRKISSCTSSKTKTPC